MEKAKIRPLATPKPQIDRRDYVLGGTRWTAPGTQNFVAIGSGVYAPQIRDFAVPIGLLVSSFFGMGATIRLQPTTLNGFLRKIRRRRRAG